MRPNFRRDTFDQMLTFNRSPFHHCVPDVNDVWYPGRAIIKLLRYQILLASCTKWINSKQLNVNENYFANFVIYSIFLPQLGPNVYVGSGVTIGPGARVKEAIILDRAEIMVIYQITQTF